MKPEKGKAVRQRGRPRAPAVHAAILRATLELLAERGLEGFTLEGVAEQAGVGKPSIYRRWRRKEELIAEAVDSARSAIVIPESGTIWNALESLAEQGERALRTQLFRRIIAIGITASLSGAERNRMWRQYGLPRRAQLRLLLERAQERGEIRSGIDLELAMDALVGGWIYLELFHPKPRGKRAMMRLAELVLADGKHRSD